MKRIVIPVDFSETSALALKFGTSLAELMNYDLYIVHIADVVLSKTHSLTTPEQQLDERRLQDQLTEFTGPVVKEVIETNRGRTSFVPEVTMSVLSGMAASEILTLSQQENTALVVMGGVGAGAGIHLPGLYGSVANPVALRGGCPVILIPKGYGALTVGRVAVAFDDAEEVIRIGTFARGIIKALKPEVRYVHVEKADWRDEVENDDDFLDAIWGKGAPSYVYNFDVFPHGDVATQLSRYVEDKHIDLLILGGKRQGFWRRLFDKSQLKPIIQACPVPMLVIPFSADH